MGGLIPNLDKGKTIRHQHRVCKSQLLHYVSLKAKQEKKKLFVLIEVEKV